MPSVSELGKRIKREKGARGWSYETLSGRSGVSVAALKRVVSGVQQGMHVDSVSRVAAAFGLPVDELTGHDAIPAAEAAADGVRNLRNVVLSPAMLPGLASLAVVDGEPRGVVDLAEAVTQGWANYWGGRLDLVVMELPALIAECRLAAAELGAASAALPLAQAWELAATALVNYGQEDLAGMAAERAVNAAALGDDPLLTATVTGTYSWVLLHQGRYADAEAVAVAAAMGVTPPRRAAAPAALASYGNLLMCAVAPRVALLGDPADLVDEARGIGAQLGGKTPVFQTAFGPNTVAMQEVYAYAMLKRPGRAMTAARAVELDQLEGISRGRHWLDLAQVHVDAGRTKNALGALKAASAMSPEWFGRQGIARSLVRQVREELTRPSDEVMALASLARVDTSDPGVSLVI